MFLRIIPCKITKKKESVKLLELFNSVKIRKKGHSSHYSMLESTNDSGMRSFIDGTQYTPRLP